MSLDADVLILGGSCAGLSLAAALSERAPKLHVKTLEGRSHYSRDRTWCFWNTAQHPFSAGVTHRWHSWRVRHAEGEARQHSRRYSYQHLPADHFYELAAEKIYRAGQELALGVEVHSVEGKGGACEVETSQGKLRSRWVFDSRNPEVGEQKSILEQRFISWHVRTERACFDASVVDLMDFQSAGSAVEQHSLYVLPFSATEALVEATFLDHPKLLPADAEAMLCQYMRQLSSTDYRVLYGEAATLPMGVYRTHRHAQGSVVNIGTRGGRLKASSGYAFQRIQRQSAAFADALAKQAPLPQTFEPRFYSILDQIFLRALQSAPDRVASYFMMMFRKLPPDTLVRFLSETASPGEVLQVMLSLPKSDFLKAAILPNFSEKNV